MTLEEQLNQLIEQAPDHGVSMTVMQQGIAPVIEGVARSLQHTSYYICESQAGQWVSTVLQRGSTTKTVLYAFSDRAIAEAAPNQTGTPFVIQPTPVAQLLFQLIALKPIDSLLFVEETQPQEKITEIKRADFQQAIQKSLKKLRSQSDRTYLA